ncbi:putative pterin-4-alpha-carbinolamine dehydratase [Jeongeupia sp. HS-3]|uniref:4a-hydroxytetrahydrobiopterin dehydratase n=1 Tax=Jeongeupia sp. HS-3 TaxID=1009682 RepID=UPI0018A4FD16|nr:4a-hydroxytetrahydrobiopterin dehydratase [Jeongeupia sp. HS-3]BCL75594.1 putative pterin-4-alpha-carbinolamine dehydratase [Jeongeupia sp. HS-3]
MSLATEYCIPNAPAMPAEDTVKLAAGQLDRWQVLGTQLEKNFQFANYYETMAFVNAVAWIANSQDHHPDLAVGYNHCRVIWTTHSAGGLTRNDFICAARVDALFPEYGPE